MSKPSLAALWRNFPDHVRYPTLGDLYNHLGGTAAKNIDAPGFGPRGNACASRISVALNASGAPIKGSLVPRDRTVGSADGKRIIFGVATLRDYLVKVFGKLLIDNARPFDDAFRGKKGIIAFSVNWNDATGHIALFNGLTYREPGHDDYASLVIPRTATTGPVAIYRGEFWEMSA